MRLTEPPKTSSWYDLVYHALSHIRSVAGDASCVYSEVYVAWAAGRLTATSGPNPAIPRTLVADAEIMSRLYASSPRSCALHAFPLLWDNTAAFLADMDREFGRIEWPRPDRSRLARAILRGAGPTLPDLLRTAMWSEVANGFLGFWQDAVKPRSDAYKPLFMRHVRDVAHQLPAIANARWLLCHPLRTHGRLLGDRRAQPFTAIGVADPHFGVSEWHPVIQGCHEHFVSIVDVGREAHAQIATIPGRDGYAAFTAVEQRALELGKRFFTGSPWERQHREWLETTRAG